MRQKPSNDSEMRLPVVGTAVACILQSTTSARERARGLIEELEEEEEEDDEDEQDEEEATKIHEN